MARRLTVARIRKLSIHQLRKVTFDEVAAMNTEEHQAVRSRIAQVSREQDRKRRQKEARHRALYPGHAKKQRETTMGTVAKGPLRVLKVNGVEQTDPASLALANADLIHDAFLTLRGALKEGRGATEASGAQSAPSVSSDAPQDVDRDAIDTEGEEVF